jgi:hypothetical protein
MFKKIFPKPIDALRALIGFTAIGLLALLAIYPHFLVWPFG